MRPGKKVIFGIYLDAMSPTTKDILRRVETWPPEDQEELAELAREIEARRTGVYKFTDDERDAVKRGLAEMQERKFAPDREIAEIFRKARSSRT